MNTQWMGRYRPLISVLVQHANINLRLTKQRSEVSEGVFLSSLEWQVLEAIIENQGNTLNMNSIAGKLGIPQSTFSRTVKYLCALNLVEKYQTPSNRKNIILIPADAALQLYHSKADHLQDHVFQAFFQSLDALSDEDIRRFTAALSELNMALISSNDEDGGKLIRIE